MADGKCFRKCSNTERKNKALSHAHPAPPPTVHTAGGNTPANRTPLLTLQFKEESAPAVNRIADHQAISIHRGGQFRIDGHAPPVRVSQIGIGPHIERSSKIESYGASPSENATTFSKYSTPPATVLMSDSLSVPVREYPSRLSSESPSYKYISMSACEFLKRGQRSACRYRPP